MTPPLTPNRARRIRLGINAAHTWANLVERGCYTAANTLEEAYAATPFAPTREAFLRTQQKLIRRAFQARRKTLRNTLIKGGAHTTTGGTP